ncbi:hypothetical protein [Lentzea jiangxiensis]|uniref:Uncharacterized protein n=1 Tax=Lentzea jiangxiensis TaxID=641025 RepID=A0A1H0X6C9_9PSEU|nr:hypothetical protein [Lentzea jiangxiensis]SDP98493.1 hypothetical protein SAMN05421507_14015 [Lentzea jiangxiensis]
MASIAEVRATVYGHLNDMEQAASSVMGLQETLAGGARGVRAAVDRRGDYSAHVSDTEALFGPVVRIADACTALSEAIAEMRAVADSW